MPLTHKFSSTAGDLASALHIWLPVLRSHGVQGLQGLAGLAASDDPYSATDGALLRPAVHPRLSNGAGRWMQT